MAQIMAAVQQHEAGMSVGDITRKLGFSDATYYHRKKEYGSLVLSQVREVKQLRDENARLKKLVADLCLDKAMLQDINSRKW